MTREEAWKIFFDTHPECVATWRYQNGYWPMGMDSDPYSLDFDPAAEQDTHPHETSD